MNKIEKLERVLKSGTNHRLKRKRLIEARLKAFGQKSIPNIPSIFKPRIEAVKRISWWTKLLNWLGLIFYKK